MHANNAFGASEKRPVRGHSSKVPTNGARPPRGRLCTRALSSSRVTRWAFVCARRVIPPGCAHCDGALLGSRERVVEVRVQASFGRIGATFQPSVSSLPTQTTYVARCRVAVRETTMLHMAPAHVYVTRQQFLQAFVFNARMGWCVSPVVKTCRNALPRAILHLAHAVFFHGGCVTIGTA